MAKRERGKAVEGGQHVDEEKLKIIIIIIRYRWESFWRFLYVKHQNVIKNQIHKNQKQWINMKN